MKDSASTTMELFRREALEARDVSRFGTIILIRPVSLTVMSIFAACLALVIIGFLAWGSYTKKATVHGQLVPASGVIRIQAPLGGRVVSRYVQEGQEVKKGQLLYVLSNERDNLEHGATQALISAQMRMRLQSLEQERLTTERMGNEEHRALQRQVVGLRSELQVLKSQLPIQRDKVQLAQASAKRYERLFQQDFVSREKWESAQAEYLEQDSLLKSLQRDYARLSLELNMRQDEAERQTLEQKNRLASLMRNISSVNEELAENDARRETSIQAPVDGIATTILAQPGQVVDLQNSLLTLVPTGEILKAHLYAPSRSIGFVQPGSRVYLRYEAYPYQKFGQYAGRVESLSKASLSPEDAQEYSTLLPAATLESRDSIYRISVALDRQSVDIHGRQQPLTAGMRVTASIEEERRKLYEWVLEPIYSLKNKYTEPGSW